MITRCRWGCTYLSTEIGDQPTTLNTKTIGALRKLQILLQEKRVNWKRKSIRKKASKQEDLTEPKSSTQRPAELIEFENRKLCSTLTCSRSKQHLHKVNKIKCNIYVTCSKLYINPSAATAYTQQSYISGKPTNAIQILYISTSYSAPLASANILFHLLCLPFSSGSSLSGSFLCFLSVLSHMRNKGARSRVCSVESVWVSMSMQLRRVWIRGASSGVCRRVGRCASKRRAKASTAYCSDVQMR